MYKSMIASADTCRLVEIAVPLPLSTAFTYSVPREITDAPAVGMRVLVPLGRRLLTGYVVGFPEKPPRQEIRDIADILDSEPLFSADDLSFYRWAAAYYHYPLGLTIKTALPPGINIEYTGAVAITGQGEQALSEDPSDFPGRKVLELLRGQGTIALKNLANKAGRAGFACQIRALRAQGYIASCLQKKRGTVGIRREKCFAASGGMPEGRLGGKQQEVLNYITQHGGVSAAVLQERFGNCGRVTAALEKKKLITVTLREVFRRPPAYEAVFHEPEHALTPEQKKVLEQAEPALAKKTFYPLLLHGVTGSGKTEIYLNVMNRVLKRGSQCLYLVPEIALTAQLYDRISSRLNAPLAMLHSSLTDAERFDAWRLIRRGEVKVVLGARSALFASFADLGAVIVDEEHDPSYKQDEGFRYNARDLALVKAQRAGCIVILGSATPSLESYANAAAKKYSLAVLHKRVEDRPLPRVSIVDVTAGPSSRKEALSVISKPLQQAMARRLADGKQSLLFLNRRGFAPAYVCLQCGAPFKCPNCAVSLINHRGAKKLCCHYCDFTIPVPEACPACGSYFLAPLGWGTERLEAELRVLFPAARVARMDRDTAARRETLHGLLRDMCRGKIDILVGTQMLVKGYHLPGVTLVGVVCADQSLHFPDYRASERTFQLLTQVAGRAGRGDTPGEVIIQTYTPDHYSILCAQQHDYRNFYAMEMKCRRELGYPPYTKMINLRFEGTNRTRVEECARLIGGISAKLLAGAPNIEVLGPSRAPWEKIRGRFRYHMLLKGPSAVKLRGFVIRCLEQADPYLKKSGVAVIVDVDPLLVM